MALIFIIKEEIMKIKIMLWAGFEEAIAQVIFDKRYAAFRNAYIHGKRVEACLVWAATKSKMLNEN